MLQEIHGKPLRVFCNVILYCTVFFIPFVRQCDCHYLIKGYLTRLDLVAYLEQNGLLTELQSAYRRGRCTETNIIKVVTDFLSAADRVDQVTLHFSAC